MVNYCAVIGCTSSGGRDKVSFYRLPAIITNQGERTKELSEKRRTLWLSRLSRADLSASSYPYIRVCSKHFVSGKPSPLYGESDINWAPSLHLGHDKLVQTPTPARARRLKERKDKTENLEAAKSLLSLYEERTYDDINSAHSCDTTHFVTATQELEECGRTKCLQTDLTSDVMIAMQSELNRLTAENVDLKEKLSSTTLSEDFFKDDEKVRLFTGLPSYMVLMTLFKFIEPAMTHGYNSTLSKFQKLVLVLIRLKLNLPVNYLADKFRISGGSVSRIFLCTLNVMYTRLNPLIFWPTQEERRLTMPMEFRKYFGLKVAIIIDCFELFIERPSNLQARAQTWSSYKHHNTVKFLIGISPQGVISFISKGYGGRATDRYITNDCGLLDKIEFGDIVLADRGFDIAETLAQFGSELRIPAFTKGRSQLSPLDVEKTRKLAHVRIHVERVIGLVRNKFKMLQDTVPLDYLMSANGSIPTIDKIVTICCALANMCKSVVPFD